MESSPTFRGTYDVVVVGGGIVGLSAAYFLRLRAPTLRVAVVERDSSYARASTPRASGGCRIQFSCPENISMSLFSIAFIRDFSGAMGTARGTAPVDWVQGGYLLLAEREHVPMLERNFTRQRDMGCDVVMLDAAGLEARFPSMRVDDLAAGVLSPSDGWCDPHSMLQGTRRKVIEMGVEILEDEVVGFEVERPRVRRVALHSGARLGAEHFVNAAGAWAGEVGRLAGMTLPISPLRRFEHYFTPGTPMERLPYVKDLHRMAFRSEGAGFSGGVVDPREPRGFNLEVDHDYFERVVWPAVAHRFPPLEAARCHRTWSGLYEQCELDGNPIIGNWPGVLDNFHVCAGFSGHGMMHAPAAGRAIAERILDGRDVSIDLARFGYQRVLDDAPYPESGIL